MALFGGIETQGSCSRLASNFFVAMYGLPAGVTGFSQYLVNFSDFKFFFLNIVSNLLL